MRFFKENDGRPENRLTETQVVKKIQDRYKISQRRAKELAQMTVSHLRFLREPSSNTDVWNQLLADEELGSAS